MAQNTNKLTNLGQVVQVLTPVKLVMGVNVPVYSIKKTNFSHSVEGVG